MKSELTDRFLAYRKSGARRSETYGPEYLPPAPTDGYINNTESKDERRCRIRDYLDKKFILGPLDRAFLKRDGFRIHYIMRKKTEAARLRKGELNLTTARVMVNSTCSNR